METVNNTYSNNTLNEYEEMFKKSKNFMETSRKINLIGSVAVVLIGFLGNLLIFIVFFQKKHRSNSSHVYLFCSSINDNLFLVIHVLEDILKTFRDVYSLEENHLVNWFNVTDKNDVTCRLINYLRNVLRFISVYIVVIFTIQRLYIVHRPLSTQFKRQKAAWQTVLAIIAISMAINFWVPLVFQINSIENNQKYCDIKEKYKKEYFFINIAYICLIMLLPMVQIMLCNSLIILKTLKNDKLRRKMHSLNMKSGKQRTNSKKKTTTNESKTFLDTINNREVKSSLMRKSAITVFMNDESTLSRNRLRVKPYYMTYEKMINKKAHKKQGSSKKLTLMLLVISFSFVVLNFPYLLEWMIFFYKTSSVQLDLIERNHLIAALQISEIFYVKNHMLHFEIYYFFFFFKVKNV